MAPEMALADLAAFKTCVLNKLVEILEIGVIIWLISVAVEEGLEGLARRLGEEAGENALRKLAKALGKKIIPWVGALLIIAELLLLLKDCVPLLF
jgi:hypothetical protein